MGLWSPDGRHILYGSTRDDQGTNTYVKAVGGPEAEVPLFTSGYREHQQIPTGLASYSCLAGRIRRRNGTCGRCPEVSTGEARKGAGALPADRVQRTRGCAFA